MYKIDSSKDKPDIEFLHNYIEGRMKAGVRVHNVSLLLTTITSQIEKYIGIIRESYGVSNPASPKQVIAYLESLQDPHVVDACVDSKTGKWSSSKECLRVVESLGYSFASDMLQYRTYKSYYNSVNQISESTVDGLIHPVVNRLKTNRVSYSSPAIMGIPKKLLWECIAAPSEEYTLYSIDIKNQEPSILINTLGIDKLKPALTDPRGLYESIYDTIEITSTINLHYPSNQDELAILVDSIDTELSSIDSLKSTGYAILDNTKLRSFGIAPSYYSPNRVGFKQVYIGEGDTLTDIEIQAIQQINILVLNRTIPIKNIKYPSDITVYSSDRSTYKLPFSINFDTYSKSTGRITVALRGITKVCTGAVRKEFKSSWLALSYGASKNTILHNYKNIDGEAVYSMYMSIPQLSKYRSQCKSLAASSKNQVPLLTTYFGSVVSPVSDRANSHYKSGPVSMNQLLDLPIQGAGADILALLVKHFVNYTTANNLTDKLFIYYTRHDELIIAVHNDYIQQHGTDGVESTLRDLLEHQVDDWDPFMVEVVPIDSTSTPFINELTQATQSDTSDDEDDFII